MDLERETQSADEYFVTASQIFDCCGSESTGTLRVDTLMDKFAPFVKTNNTEYSHLKSLLDPNESNPEINVTKLAMALNKYSESLKTKVDLEESFNLKTGQLMPQDSDSGISTDAGYQLLEELHCELREKAHLAQQLRSQLDFADRQHEEALATLTAERDSLRAHMSMLREENMALTHARRDYDEACERLCGSDQALGEARRELDSYKKRYRVMHEQVATLESEKLTLQELLSKSKDECHRINEMYASRQSALLEQNETLKTDRADLSARLQDQDEFLQQIIKEKVLLEMELKDVLNKSNHTALAMDRSIDVSYTDDQMLTALDSLNADSRFAPGNQLLDEESFINALREDQGRATNMSIFDEIRLSICNVSRQNLNNDSVDNYLDNLESSLVTVGTQTDEGFNDGCNNNCNRNCSDCLNDSDARKSTTYQEVSLISVGVQTEEVATKIEPYHHSNKDTVQSDKFMTTIGTQTEPNVCDNKVQTSIGMQTEPNACDNKVQTTIGMQTEPNACDNKVQNKDDCLKCKECEKMNKYAAKLERDLHLSHRTLDELRQDLDKYEDNLNILQKLIDEGKDRNGCLQTIVHSLESKISILEAACANHQDRIKLMTCDTCSAECQTGSEQMSVATQAEVPCVDCDQRHVATHRGLRRYLWEPLKCLFQVFAVICFLCAVGALYGATRAGPARCERDATPVPWRWLHAQDLMDLLLRIEYVSDVPM